MAKKTWNIKYCCNLLLSIFASIFVPFSCVFPLFDFVVDLVNVRHMEQNKIKLFLTQLYKCIFALRRFSIEYAHGLLVLTLAN